MAALLSALALLAPLPGDAAPVDPRHRGCHTAACDRRMERKQHGKTLRRWRRIVRPHNARLDRIAACESSGRWHIATGNGFYGGLQFTLASWRAVSGDGMPHQASVLEQKYRAVRLMRIQGWGAWPHCQYA